MDLLFHNAAFVFTFLFMWSPAYSQQATFAHVRVENGPTLQYPAHWKIADETTVQNRIHAGQAMADAAGIELTGFKKRNRVVIESSPFPNTAQIRASVLSPQAYSQEESSSRKLTSSDTVKIEKVGTVQVERIAGRLALVIPYTRYTQSDRVLWHVEQIKIPFEDRLLSMTY